jgi:hypothetical protein
LFEKQFQPLLDQDDISLKPIVYVLVLSQLLLEIMQAILPEKKMLRSYAPEEERLILFWSPECWSMPEMMPH